MPRRAAIAAAATDRLRHSPIGQRASLRQPGAHGGCHGRCGPGCAEQAKSCRQGRGRLGFSIRRRCASRRPCTADVSRWHGNPQYIWWKFVSSRKKRIEQAKEEWEGGRFRPVLSVHLPPLPYALALAPPAESSPAPKIFLQKRLSQKGYPFMGRTIFGEVFVRGGMTEIFKRKVPPTGGPARATGFWRNY